MVMIGAPEIVLIINVIILLGILYIIYKLIRKAKK